MFGAKAVKLSLETLELWPESNVPGSVRLGMATSGNKGRQEEQFRSEGAEPAHGQLKPKDLGSCTAA